MKMLTAKELWTGHLAATTTEYTKKGAKSEPEEHLSISLQCEVYIECVGALPLKSKIILKFNPGVVLEKRGFECSWDF